MLVSVLLYLTVTIFTSLLPMSYVAPEVVFSPSSVTVFSGSTAEFTCHTKNEHYAYWILNGMILNDYNSTLPPRIDVDTGQESVANDCGTNYMLTITARTEYHGIVFQCVAGVGGGGPGVESKNATLMVQGTVELRLVGHVANMYTDLIHPLPVQVCWIQ